MGAQRGQEDGHRVPTAQQTQDCPQHTASGTGTKWQLYLDGRSRPTRFLEFFLPEARVIMCEGLVSGCACLQGFVEEVARLCCLSAGTAEGTRVPAGSAQKRPWDPHPQGTGRLEVATAGVLALPP